MIMPGWLLIVQNTIGGTPGCCTALHSWQPWYTGGYATQIELNSTGAAGGKQKSLASKPMGTFLCCEEGAPGAGGCRQDECNAQPHCLMPKRNVSGKIILLLAVKWEPQGSSPNNERQTTVH